jgi:DUF3040 family protein
MSSRWEREQLRGIERWFETDDPRFARAMRDAVAPHRSHRGLICVVADLAATAMFVVSFVVVSFPLLMGSVAVVAVALTMHILWPPAGRC